MRYKIGLFYSFAFAISWTFWLLMSAVYQGTIDLTTLILSTIGALGPLISLGILEKLSRGEIQVEKILSTIRIRGVKRRWFFPAIFAIPAVTVLGNLLNFLVGWDGQLRFIKPGTEELGIFVLPLMIVHFGGSLITSPLFEEPGWRGFALGELQRKIGREGGSLVVGTLWWIWHQPMWITVGLQPSIYTFLSFVSFSFMTDSLFNLSERNLFTAMLAHQSAGTVNMFLQEGHENAFALILLVGIVTLLRFREWRMKSAEDARN